MTRFLATQKDVVVSGTAESEGVFRDRFAHVIVLSAPIEVLLDRVTRRASKS
ncbi:hypothetical protein [Microbacterium sp. ABRD28]|uniref:hypothetical protein n=1 Tax=Microbacterium sp. ABRD28 TaxID=2268461 RepID=UPI0013DDB01F|nr:hypothetical protein [Microbacterium sp. ABRD28]